MASGLKPCPFSASPEGSQFQKPWRVCCGQCRPFLPLNAFCLLHLSTQARGVEGPFLLTFSHLPLSQPSGRLRCVPNPSLPCRPHLRPWLEVCRCYLGHELTHRHDILPCWAGKCLRATGFLGQGHNAAVPGQGCRKMRTSPSCFLGRGVLLGAEGRALQRLPLDVESTPRARKK